MANVLHFTNNASAALPPRPVLDAVASHEARGAAIDGCGLRARGRYHDGRDRHCLVGAIDHLCRKHRIPSGKALFYLQEALPPRRRGLVYFNDHHCSGTADLQSLIVKARALALGEEERQRAAAGVERWLLGELERERAAKMTTVDEPSMPVLSPLPVLIILRRQRAPDQP